MTARGAGQGGGEADHEYGLAARRRVFIGYVLYSTPGLCGVVYRDIGGGLHWDNYIEPTMGAFVNEQVPYHDARY